ncbi:MAG: excinuclease ABC subunit UvrC [Candidatus Sericytochromatia bacterium]
MSNINLEPLPEKSGVYLMYNKENTVIYVGKAINLKNRVKSYFQNKEHNEKTKALVSNIDRYDFIVTDNEVEALILENNLIKKFKPKYNILLKDDRYYPYIKITLKDTYPQVLPARKIEKDGAKYYGPYPTMSSMYEVKSLVERMFPVKFCETPVYKDRPCLYYHLKQCLAPCISWVEEKIHREMIGHVCTFLDGKTDGITAKLTEEMLKSAENLDFERAANLRDLIKSLERYNEKQKIITSPDINQDIIGTFFDKDNIFCQVFQVREGKLIGKIDFNYLIKDEQNIEDFMSNFLVEYYEKTENIPSEIIIETFSSDFQIVEKWLSTKKGKKVKINQAQKGQKKELLEMVIKNAELYSQKLKSDNNFQVSRQGVLELKEYLNLNFMPLKIEGFDISHMQGTNTVASMVVFENGKPKKSEYRKFKINFSEGEPNDFASMYEVVYRRYRRVLNENLERPDLILIDGGKGQLSSAMQALSDLKYPYKAVISLAKRLEEVFLPNQKEPINIPENSYALKLLQNVRDESHRFAITFHRDLRGKSMTKSFLDDIKGIGKERKKYLLDVFETMGNIKNASIEELIKKGKLPEKVAKELHEKLLDI